MQIFPPLDNTLSTQKPTGKTSPSSKKYKKSSTPVNLISPAKHKKRKGTEAILTEMSFINYTQLDDKFQAPCKHFNDHKPGNEQKRFR